MKHIVKIVIILSIFYFNLTSCGIDAIVYLSEKAVVRDISALVFEGPDIQDSYYFGIFIFYKIYAIEADAINDLSLIESRQNTENAVPGSHVESFLIASNYLDYQQLVLDNALTIPTIDKGTFDINYFASINFSAASNVEPILSIKDGSLNTLIKEFKINRSTLGSNGNYLSFLDEPINGNQDFRFNSNDENVHEYHIQFFATAYGFDLSDLSELYGDAVYLGRVKQYF